MENSPLFLNPTSSLLGPAKDLSTKIWSNLIIIKMKGI